MPRDTYDAEQLDRIKNIPKSAPPVTSRSLPSSVTKQAPVVRPVSGGTPKGSSKKK